MVTVSAGVTQLAVHLLHLSQPPVGPRLVALKWYTSHDVLPVCIPVPNFSFVNHSSPSEQGARPTPGRASA